MKMVILPVFLAWRLHGVTALSTKITKGTKEMLASVFRAFRDFRG